MKKTLSITLLMLLLLALPIILIGCKDSSAAKIVGTWEYEKTLLVNEDGTGQRTFIEEKLIGQKIIFNKNKTGQSITPRGTTHNITWEMKGSIITVMYYVEGELAGSDDFTLENGKLVFTSSGEGSARYQKSIYKKIN